MSEENIPLYAARTERIGAESPMKQEKEKTLRDIATTRMSTASKEKVAGIEAGATTTAERLELEQEQVKAAIKERELMIEQGLDPRVATMNSYFSTTKDLAKRAGLSDETTAALQDRYSPVLPGMDLNKAVSGFTSELAQAKANQKGLIPRAWDTVTNKLFGGWGGEEENLTEKKVRSRYTGEERVGLYDAEGNFIRWK
jgi:hypothetical protein